MPYGSVGKCFVSELARLYKAFASKSAVEGIALKAAIVLPILVLQKPSAKSKAKEHSVCLERRMKTWQEGDLCDLLLEGRTVQQRIPKPTHESHSKHQERLARSFASYSLRAKPKLPFAY